MSKLHIVLQMKDYIFLFVGECVQQIYVKDIDAAVQWLKHVCDPL